MDFGVAFGAVAPVPFGSMVGRTKPGRPAEESRQGRRAFLSRINRRRFACLRAAAEAVEFLPAEGESVHWVMSGAFDLMHLLIVLLNRLGSPCDVMRVATLSLSRRNVQEMAALHDDGKVRRLEVSTSDFHRKHDPDIFAELLQEFGRRGQRVGAARSHCKIVTLALDDGRRYALTGSANLRSNKNLEAATLAHDAATHGFYDTWLEAMISAHEVRPSDDPTAG